MILYHTSDTEISKPDVLHSRKNVDFGKGFYTTSLLKQAQKWSERFVRLNGQGVISRYELDDDVFHQCKILSFDSYSDEWLDFVVKCRKELDTSDYDIVMGGVANDNVFNTVELYINGWIERDAAIKRLAYQEPNMQLCLRNQLVIDKYLHFLGSEII